MANPREYCTMIYRVETNGLKNLNLAIEHLRKEGLTENIDSNTILNWAKNLVQALDDFHLRFNVIRSSSDDNPTLLNNLNGFRNRFGFVEAKELKLNLGSPLMVVENYELLGGKNETDIRLAIVKEIATDEKDGGWKLAKLLTLPFATLERINTGGVRVEKTPDNYYKPQSITIFPTSPYCAPVPQGKS